MTHVRTYPGRLTGLLVVFSLLLGGGAGLAQDATPTGAAAVHPAHIHSGTCDTLGDVVYPLTDVAIAGAGTPAASPEAAAASTPIAAADPIHAESATTVEVTLDDLLSAEHAINVHESAENIANYIACGDITGEPDDGTLDIELLELNDSRFRGTARLTDNGDGTTSVFVMISQVDAGTPEATPAS